MTQANSYVEKISTGLRTRPTLGTRVERVAWNLTFYTFPDGSKARIDRGSDKRPSDAQEI